MAEFGIAHSAPCGGGYRRTSLKRGPLQAEDLNEAGHGGASTSPPQPTHRLPYSLWALECLGFDEQAGIGSVSKPFPLRGISPGMPRAHSYLAHTFLRKVRVSHATYLRLATYIWDVGSAERMPSESFSASLIFARTLLRGRLVSAGEAIPPTWGVALF